MVAKGGLVLNLCCGSTDLLLCGGGRGLELGGGGEEVDELLLPQEGVGEGGKAWG